jgi:hypothetical protein
MHLIVEKDNAYWNNRNLRTCLVDSLTWLRDGLDENYIPDVFFPQVTVMHYGPNIFNNCN